MAYLCSNNTVLLARPYSSEELIGEKKEVHTLDELGTELGLKNAKENSQ